MEFRRRTYSSAVAVTFEFSRLSCKLLELLGEFTACPTFLLSFPWTSDTFAQTSDCDLAEFAASFRSFDTIRSFDDVNLPDSSPSLFVQRPDSTQYAWIF